MNVMAEPTSSPSYGDPLSANVPKTMPGLWAGLDMRAEPLDVEILKEWEEDGIVLKVLRYRVGIFKGQKAMMGAVYGYPKGGSKLPGLVQIHGGGQYADYKAALTNAKRGYATISIAWAGRISAPDYKVDPDVVKLFWEGKTSDPNYKLTTDWGALDAYHAPCRNEANDFTGIKPGAWTLDTIESPRNSPWFLCTFAARRALTFLEQQPEVDAKRLGVYGHSMGGKITVLTAGTDNRVKAAVPSCGGISDLENKNPLFCATLTDDQYLKAISCPILFLSPSNDFHGRINDLPAAVKEIQSPDWRLSISPHHNHQDTAEYEVATQVWMDQCLKGLIKVPQTPKTTLTLKTDNGVPKITVEPDTSRPILGVEVYYSREGRLDEKSQDRENTIHRFWYFVSAQKHGEVWKAELPLCGLEKPLWVYANVIYGLDAPIQGAGYYYGDYSSDQFVISSLPHLVSVAELQAAGVKLTKTPSLLIESFEGDWQKQWFTYNPKEWGRSTHKVYTDEWKAPTGARLAFEVRADQPNKFAIGLNSSAAEVILKGGPEWQHVSLASSDFLNATNEPLKDWTSIMELRFSAKESLNNKTAKREIGGKWKGSAPQFRNLRWVVGD
jgi:hypothetical protein